MGNQSLKNELLELLDLGEAEAIVLTIEKNAEFLIIRISPSLYERILIQVGELE